MEVDQEGNVKRDLTQPEVLSCEHILQVLQSRGVDVGRLERAGRAALVQEYYRRACPLPQRAYRNNRRGARMTRNQIHLNKRKRSHAQTEDSNTYRIQENTVAARSGLVNSHLPQSERLKPPPSAISTERTVIRLGGASARPASTPTPAPHTSRAAAKTTVNVTSKSPSADLNSGFSDITIHCKDYSKKQSATEATLSDSQHRDTQPTSGNGIPSPTSPKTAAKIRLKKPSSDFSNQTQNGSGLQGAHVAQRTANGGRAVQQEMAAASGLSITSVSVSDNLISCGNDKTVSNSEVANKKFKRVDVKWP